MTIKRQGSIGSYLPIQIKQGSDFQLEIVLTNKIDGTPLNTALYTAQASMRKAPFRDPSIAIACSFPVLGRLRLFLARSATALLSCGADLEDDASSYEWDCELITIASGIITPAFYGPANVFRDI